jgi:penicillin amidase
MRSTRLLPPLFLVAACSSNPIDGITITDTVKNAALSGTVDVVRDQWGVPHIYGGSPGDVAFAEGYMMAMDRLVAMDLARHRADGTLAELLGDAQPSLIDLDIQMRVHHLRSTAQRAWQMLVASTDPADVVAAQMLTKFAAGVNAYVADLQFQRYQLPPALDFVFDPKTFKTWTETDSLLLGQLQTFELAFDPDSDIYRTQLDAAGAAQFDHSTDPARAARKGIAADLETLAPVDHTYTLPGVDAWTGFNGDATRASRDPDPQASDVGLLPLYAAARQTVRGLGHDAQTFPTVGSNNWIIGPSLSKTGHVLVANDTHLPLSNPPSFYMVHLKSTGTFKLDVMGVQFAGLPGVILGMNEHVAWGATVNYIDITDVYQETIVTCDDGQSPCVLFNGQKVALQPRIEEIKIGRFGSIVSSVSVKLWDVPHHGPIIPRITSAHQTEALAGQELSIRYTGYEPAPKLATVIYGLDVAAAVKDSVAAIDSGFLYGNQNWVIGDDQGNFGWTQFTRTPRRSPKAPPWKVLPGDGTAEWGGDMDPRYIPHALNPQQGFLATANNDPIGVTDDGDPFFDEPMVDGAPLYLGADYDPGTRVGRITKRIRAATDGGGKLGLDDLASIQADAVTEWGQIFGPTVLAAAQAVADEIAQPGTHPDLQQLVAQADVPAKMLVPAALSLLRNWSTYDTPSGVDEDQPPQQVDSQAATVFNVWLRYFADRALSDELMALNMPLNAYSELRVLTMMVQHPDQLHSGLGPSGDALLFGNLASTTPESKQVIAAEALFDALDYLLKTLGSDVAQWRWGRLHTLALEFLAPVPALRIPLAADPKYPNGFPRHGDIDTVDAAGDSLTPGDYGYNHGPAIRFACELDPHHGPRARNVLPGGEVLDPGSPHYADMMELWRRNQTFDLAFSDGDVAASAKLELTTHGIGRLHFTPR